MQLSMFIWLFQMKLNILDWMKAENLALFRLFPSASLLVAHLGLNPDPNPNPNPNPNPSPNPNPNPN